MPTSSASPAMHRILRLMAVQNASDVYLSGGSPVTLRIEGQCRAAGEQILPPQAPLQLLGDIVPAARIEQLQASGELNMAVALAGIGNFRISALRKRGHYAVVIRYIRPDIPPLASLQLPQTLQELVMQKRGLILMVGATGTGKSTTLAAMLDYRNARAGGHILTFEDPIEYIFKSKKSIVSQREIGADTQSLAVGLKNGLRQAPDVIMIGEIRDRTSMDAAIMYAQTGHLCLATLHANNAYHTLNRILSFYPPQTRSALLGELAAALRAIVSQRLIPGRDGKRVPAAEVLLNTRLISELIEKGDFPGIKEAMEKTIAEGSQTFEQDLARLIDAGRISREDGLAFADSPANLIWRLRNQTPDATLQTSESDTAQDTVFADLSVDVPARAPAALRDVVR